MLIKEVEIAYGNKKGTFSFMCSFYLQSGFLSLFSFENISQQKKLKMWNTLQIHTFLPRIKGVNVFKDYGSNITSICIPRILKSICSVFQIFNFLCCEIFSEEKGTKNPLCRFFSTINMWKRKEEIVALLWTQQRRKMHSLVTTYFIGSSS